MEQKPRLNRIHRWSHERDPRLLFKSTLRRIAMGEIRAKVRLENYDDMALFRAGKISKNKMKLR